MPSITTWTRLETRQRTDDLDVTLAARVHDPLWSLARQWQMGEFRGHDSGSPVEVSMRGSVGRLDRYLAGTPGDDSVIRSRPYDDTAVPLEALVEAEPLTAQTAPRVAIEAGAHLIRLLQAEGLEKYRGAFVAAFPLPAPPDAALDPAGARFHNVMSLRIPNGLTLREAVLGSGNGISLPDVGADPVDVATLVGVAGRWLTWFDTMVEAASGNDTWVADRLEHSFGVAATVDGDERVLVSKEYSSGSLDWHDFDLDPGVSLGSALESTPVVRTVLPAPVTFPGMPRPRWWEFEDAKVDLGAIEAGADDIARMLMVGFAVDYGNDWFVVPIELPVGSLTRIRSLEVTDTFGVRSRIRSAADVDGEPAQWRMYSITGADEESDELLFLPPVLARSLDGPVRERVSIVRDELANLAWAIEDVTESITGLPRRRDEEATPPGRRRGAGSEPLTYEVATGVSRWWHPLVAVADEEGAARLEQRQLHPPTGTLLGATPPLRLFEEEVAGEGLRVERIFQVARWMRGGTAVWSSRQRAAGRGPTSSGLRFDDVQRSEGAEPS